MTARPSRDVVVAGRQETTREKWLQITQDYDPYISALVLQEARQGDPDAAQKRLDAIRALPVLDITEATQRLAAQLLAHHGIPAEYPEDALHIAVAKMNAMDVLLTWNFSHINNVFTRTHIRQIIEEEGYQCPEICSPEEL